MSLRARKSPLLLIIILLAIGALAALTLLSLVNHQGDLPNWGIIIAVVFGVFFITWTWALMLYLRDRDTGHVTHRASEIDVEALKGTVYGLAPGVEYQVVQPFTDYYQNNFQRGERLHFKERHFLPYHGGHTIIFVERPLYLQEDANNTILTNFSAYIAARE